MQCDRAQELFSDYLEATLDGSIRAGLESHIGQCHPCHEELGALRETLDALSALPEVTPPADAAWKVMCRLQEVRLAIIFPK